MGVFRCTRPWIHPCTHTSAGTCPACQQGLWAGSGVFFLPVKGNGTIYGFTRALTSEDGKTSQFRSAALLYIYMACCRVASVIIQEQQKLFNITNGRHGTLLALLESY